MHPKLNYSTTTFLLGICAIAFACVVGSTIGDTDNVLRVQLWFAWQIPFYVIGVSDQNPHVRIDKQHAALPFFVRLAFVAAAMIQSVAFLVWGAVHWSGIEGAVPAFFPLVVALLGGYTLLLFITFIVLVRYRPIRPPRLD